MAGMADIGSKWLKMAGNSWKQLEPLKIVRQGWEWLKWLEMAENGFKWLHMAGPGWALREIARNS